MKPATSDPTEHLRLLRQQLILAQVRIMELEDSRDELLPRLAEAEKMREQAQELSDQQIDIARNLDETLSENATQLRATQEQLYTLNKEVTALNKENARLQSLLDQAEQAHTTTLTRQDALNATLNTLKRSRSWRWTAWLRALGL